MKPLALLLPTILLASHAAAAAPGENSGTDLWTGEGISLGGVIFPAFNYQAAFGTGSMNPGDLATGHHDPNRHGITQQDIEFALRAKLGERIHLAGIYAAVIGGSDQWFGDFEEYHATITGLPLGARLKGGLFYTRFGYENTRHPHDLTLVDRVLPAGRLIGEDNLAVYGAEISLPILRSLPAGWDDRLTASYGAVPDPAEEEHEEGPESRFEGEGALFQDWALTVDYTLGYTAQKDRRYELGLSGAFGKNNFERQTQLYGLHFDYLWRPAGADADDGHSHGPASEFLRWRTELFVREFGAADEAGARDNFTDAGAYTLLSYGFPSGKVAAHLRGEYASGVAAAGLPERWRVSPALTWHPSERLPIHFKLQYNADYSPAFGNEHSVFLQFNFTWGDRSAHAH